jgi:putative acetyltransferase
MNISLEPPDQPEVIELIAELDAYQDALYPPESRHSLGVGALKEANVRFFVARDEARRAVGCCAVVLDGTQGEVKSMFVSPRCRGQGVAQGLLRALESVAAEAGCKLLLLETGPFQPDALRLYASAGYERRGPFGSYTDDPLSVFMQKALGA